MFSYVHLMIQANIECSGVMFDSKLNWNVHIANCIGKAKKTKFALRLLKKYFNPIEMRTLHMIALLVLWID